jgi:broad specificity phosphatase PhoE
LSAQPVEGLTDLDFGKWEGQSLEIVKTQYKEIYELWRERPDLAKIPVSKKALVITTYR